MPTILVIDDSRYTRLKIVRFLTEKGFDVLEAENGSVGLTLIRDQKPHAIITDLLMPEMDGYELLEHIRADGIELPVIVITADIQDSTRQRVLKLGACAVMNKPTNLQKLLELLPRG